MTTSQSVVINNLSPRSLFAILTLDTVQQPKRETPMSSALETMSRMNLTHGRGLTGAAVGTVAGFTASTALGTLYGVFHGKWYGEWMPAFFALGGKLSALAIYLLSKGKANIATMVANDIGQAGVNAFGLDLGVKLGLKIAKKQLVVQDETTALPAGAVRIAGQLPPAEPGRSLADISVEDLANLG